MRHGGELSGVVRVPAPAVRDRLAPAHPEATAVHRENHQRGNGPVPAGHTQTYVAVPPVSHVSIPFNFYKQTGGGRNTLSTINVRALIASTVLEDKDGSCGGEHMLFAWKRKDYLILMDPLEDENILMRKNNHSPVLNRYLSGPQHFYYNWKRTHRFDEIKIKNF